ncbi:hypothetical protein GCM10023091_14200 [Ravibacter arvi]|uniref:Uncharacterized protein n=1 Tax=Ravibacter arvi TaxID=2051041 RepID=A0ABP8LTE8_9BACT
MAKKYSIAAHLIHSRIQLVPRRLQTSGKMVAGSFLLSNNAIIRKAAKAVERDHGITTTEKDCLQAAELLITACERKHETEYYVIILRGPAGDKLISSRDDGRTIIFTNPDFRYHRIKSATEMLNKIREHNPHLFSWTFIDTRWEITEINK